MINFLDDSTFGIDNYSCSGSPLFPIFQAVKFVIVIIQIAVPFALIIWGSLDWFKALIAHDEKEMRIKRKPFIARVIAAFIILLLPVLIQLIAKAFAGAKNTNNFWKCYSEAQPKIDFKAWQKSYKPYSKPEGGSGGSSTNSGSKPEGGGKTEGNGSSSSSGNVNTGTSHGGQTTKTKHCYEYSASSCPPQDDYGIACKPFLKRCATLKEYEEAMSTSGSEGR